MIAPAVAMDPYSSSVTQPGTNQGRPSVRKCQTTYVGIMLTVQIMMGSVEAVRRNGNIHSRYHGYTTGAHRSDPAIGQANASEDNAGDSLLSRMAIRKPASTASPATSCGAATRSNVANTGSLKRKLCT